MSIEDIIVFGIVIISIIGNVIKNFLKESKKDNKRVVGKPTTSPVNTNYTDQKPLFSKPSKKTVTEVKKPATKQYQKPVYQSLETLESLETFGPVESTIAKKYDMSSEPFDDISKFDISDMEEIEDYTSPIDTDEKEKPSVKKKTYTLFENESELRKAILYAAILERKY